MSNRAVPGRGGGVAGRAGSAGCCAATAVQRRACLWAVVTAGQVFEWRRVVLVGEYWGIWCLGGGEAWKLMFISDRLIVIN